MRKQRTVSALECPFQAQISQPENLLEDVYKSDFSHRGAVVATGASEWMKRPSFHSLALVATGSGPIFDALLGAEFRKRRAGYPSWNDRQTSPAIVRQIPVRVLSIRSTPIVRNETFSA